MKNSIIDTNELRMSARVKLPQKWLVDYQPAREKAIRWLGDRYLLARDIPRIPGPSSAGGQSLTSSRAGTVRPQRL